MKLFSNKGCAVLGRAAQRRYVAYNRYISVGYNEGGPVKDNFFIKIKNFISTQNFLFLVLDRVRKDLNHCQVVPAIRGSVREISPSCLTDHFIRQEVRDILPTAAQTYCK